MLPTLRRAIFGMPLAVVRFYAANAPEPAKRILCPYGILYAGSGWLVAHIARLPELRLWRLDRILFRAGGIQEMSWHPLTWGTYVTVIKPAKLRLHLANLAGLAATHHGVTKTPPIF